MKDPLNALIARYIEGGRPPETIRRNCGFKTLGEVHVAAESLGFFWREGKNGNAGGWARRMESSGRAA